MYFIPHTAALQSFRTLNKTPRKRSYTFDEILRATEFTRYKKRRAILADIVTDLVKEKLLEVRRTVHDDRWHYDMTAAGSIYLSKPILQVEYLLARLRRKYPVLLSLPTAFGLGALVVPAAKLVHSYVWPLVVQ